MNQMGHVVPFNCTIIAISTSSFGNGTWDAEVYKNGEIVTTPTEGNAIVDYEMVDVGISYSLLSVDLDAGDRISIYQRSAGTVNRPSVDLIIRRR